MPDNEFKVALSFDDAIRIGTSTKGWVLNISLERINSNSVVLRFVEERTEETND